jgi:hypothetical protein
MAGGGYILSNKASYIIGLTTSIAYAAITIGIILCIISFLGCFGAANEKGIVLKSYYILLVLLVTLELSIGIAAYVNRDSINLILENRWIELFGSNPNSLIELETEV